MSKFDYKKQGKKNRASGADFEKRTRKDLENKGYICDKWTNNVDLEKNKLVQSKNKWNNFTKSMMMGTGGFPDFIAFRSANSVVDNNYVSQVIGVECKVGKYLSAEEKEKCQWLLDNDVFSKILIAYKTKEKNKIVVNYQDFKLTSDNREDKLNMEDKTNDKTERICKGL